MFFLIFKHLNQGTLNLHTRSYYIMFVMITILKTMFLNSVGSEYILIIIIDTLSNLYCGVVYINILKAILTAL